MLHDIPWHIMNIILLRLYCQILLDVGLIFPYSSVLLYWRWGEHVIRWLKGYVFNPSNYHHQMGSIHLSHFCHIFLWSRFWGGCTIIFCHLLLIYPGNIGTLFPLLMCTLCCVKMIECIMAFGLCSFVCKLLSILLYIIILLLSLLLLHLIML